MPLDEGLIVSLLSVPCLGELFLQEWLEAGAADCCFSAQAGVEGQERLQEQQPVHLGGGAGFATDRRVVSSQGVGERKKQGQI